MSNYYHVSVTPRAEDAYRSADYSLWLPPDIQTVRGIIVKQHGCGDPAAATGLNHALDQQWQDLARKHNCALMGTKLNATGDTCAEWSDPANGTGDAFLQALAELAAQARHLEIEQVPWALWGHSGGADWALRMLTRHPSRIATVIAVRGGPIVKTTISQEILSTPILWAVGECDDVNSCMDEIYEGFLRFRSLGALWALACERDSGHECGNSRSLAIPYIDSVLSARLSTASPDLRALDEAGGWLGSHNGGRVGSSKCLEEFLQLDSWLPNEYLGLKWHNYLRFGTTEPTHISLEPGHASRQHYNYGDAPEIDLDW